MLRLPAQQYSLQDSAAAAAVANVANNWASFKSGQMVGGDFAEFQDLVTRGAVPDSPAGYDTFLYWLVNTRKAAQDGHLEFTGYSLAWMHLAAIAQQGPSYALNAGGPAALAAKQVSIWGISVADQTEILKYYNQYFAELAPMVAKLYGAPPITNLPSPAGVLPTGPVADPNAKVGIQLLYGGSSQGSRSEPVSPVTAIVGYRTASIPSVSGAITFGAWQKTPGAWVVRSDNSFYDENLAAGWMQPISAASQGVQWATEAIPRTASGGIPDTATDFLAGERSASDFLAAQGISYRPALWSVPARNVGTGPSVPPLPQPGAPAAPVDPTKPPTISGQLPPNPSTLAGSTPVLTFPGKDSGPSVTPPAPGGVTGALGTTGTTPAKTQTRILWLVVLVAVAALLLEKYGK